MSSSKTRVLITGANKGIGFATAREVLKYGDDTFVFLGSRSVERGEDAREKLISENKDWADRIEVLQIDVGDDASVKAAAETVRSKFDESTPLYGIDNNAGIGTESGDMEKILNVNVRGPHRVCEAFLPLIDKTEGRILNISSGSAPNFVSACSQERQEFFTDPDVTWEQIEELMEECLEIEDGDGDFQSAGLGSGSAYGLSKALVNCLTIALARNNPELIVNACTPGYIETDMTRPHAEGRGVSPKEMGMKSPEEGTRAPMHLLFGEPGGSGWYFGSDAERSPMDRYRSPGDPPYRG